MGFRGFGVLGFVERVKRFGAECLTLVQAFALIPKPPTLKQ